MTKTATVQIATVGRSSMFHLEGLKPIGNYGSLAGTDTDAKGNDKGFVSYSPSSACGVLSSASSLYKSYVATSHTEPGNKPGTVKRISTPTKFSIEEALAYAEKTGHKVCARCLKAAQAV